MAFEDNPRSNAPYISDVLPSPLGDDDDGQLSSDQARGPLPSSPTTQRKRRPSKGTMPSVVKRSVSTPNVRSMASVESAMSLADKRRNKLGYHRTSVACGHCRRRKIRCLLDPDDQQGRCSNCIRLKKECNFFPVDQQPPIERRPRSSSKGDGLSNEASISSSSSPALAGGHVIEQVENYHQYPPLPVHTVADMSQFTPSYGASALSPTGKVPSSSRSFDPVPSFDRSSTWENSPFLDPPPAPGGERQDHDDASRGYWKESPVTPAYSQFSIPSAVIPNQQREHGGGYPYQRDDLAWPLPTTRSMSMVNVEDLPSQYQNHYNQPFQPDFKRRMTTATEIYTPSLNTSNNSSSLSISEPQSAPISHSIGSQPAHSFGYGPGWNSFSGTHHTPSGVSKAQETFAGWYPEAPQLAQVQEEEAGHHLSGDPSNSYHDPLARHKTS